MANDLAPPCVRRPLLPFAILCVGMGAGAVLACDSEGITPNCPPDAAGCLTPPADVAAPADDAGAD